MRALRINPYDVFPLIGDGAVSLRREGPVVTELDMDYTGIESIYKQLSSEYRNVDCFDCVYLDNKNVMYVDDEGLLHRPLHFFRLGATEKYRSITIAGCGLILGTNETGHTVDASYSRSGLASWTLVGCGNIVYECLTDTYYKLKEPFYQIAARSEEFTNSMFLATAEALDV